MARLVEEASGKVALERDQLGTLMAELNQSVIVCNPDGRILLYNGRARALFRRLSRAPDSAGGAELIGLGRSIHAVIDKALIAHALETIERRLARGEAAASSRFVTTTPAGHLLQVSLAPVRTDERGALGGYVLLLDDITDDYAAQSRRDQRLTEPDRGQPRLARQHAGRPRHARLSRPRARRARALPRRRARRGGRHERASRRPRRRRLRGSPHPLAAAGDARRRPRHRRRPAHRRRGRPGGRRHRDRRDPLAQRRQLRPHRGARLPRPAASPRRRGPPSASPAAGGWAHLDLDLALRRGGGRSRRLAVRPDRSPARRSRRATWPSGTAASSGSPTTARGPRASSASSCRSPPAATPRRPPPSGPEYYDFDLFAVSDAARALDDRPLDALAFTVFDTETTGLDPAGGDEIIQMGAVRIVNGKLLRAERFDQLVDPGRSIPEAAHPLPRHPPRDAARPAAASPRSLPAFHAFAADTVLVGHNVAFDMRFLQLKEAADRRPLRPPRPRHAAPRQRRPARRGLAFPRGHRRPPRRHRLRPPLRRRRRADDRPGLPEAPPPPRPARHPHPRPGPRSRRSLLLRPPPLLIVSPTRPGFSLTFGSRAHGTHMPCACVVHNVCI